MAVAKPAGAQALRISRMNCQSCLSNTSTTTSTSSARCHISRVRLPALTEGLAPEIREALCGGKDLRGSVGFGRDFIVGGRQMSEKGQMSSQRGRNLR